MSDPYWYAPWLLLAVILVIMGFITWAVVSSWREVHRSDSKKRDRSGLLHLGDVTRVTVREFR